MNLLLTVLNFWVNWFRDEWCYLSMCLVTRSSSRWQAWHLRPAHLIHRSPHLLPPFSLSVKAPWLLPRSAWHHNPRISFPWVLPPLPLLRAKPDRRAETCSSPRSPASGAGSRALGSSCPSKTAPRLACRISRAPPERARDRRALRAERRSPHSNPNHIRNASRSSNSICSSLPWANRCSNQKPFFTLPAVKRVLLSSIPSFVCDLYTCIFKNHFQVIYDGKSWKKFGKLFLKFIKSHTV